jgi:hypothetical protein
MKNLSLVLALMIAASPAFASRARLEALGEGKNGSYYINDGRNIFLNPAQIVKYKKKLWLEFGGEPAGVDAVNSPRGQGGFSNTFGDFTYGLYLNQTSDRALNTISNVNTLASKTFISPDSAAEFFFAGEGSMNWGISVFYAGNNTASTGANQKTASLLGTRLGIESGNLAVFSTVGIISSSKELNATNDEIKGKLSVDAGVTYKMDDWTYFGKFATFGSDVLVSNTTTELRQTQFGAGFGRTTEFSKTVTMFSRLEADYQNVKTQGSADNKTWNVPVVLGAEAQALSWLAIRGSVAASLLGQNIQGNTKSSLAGTTTVAAGVGMTFGDVQVDGVVSTANLPAANTAADVTGFGSGARTVGNFGFGDAMLSRVALTYNF